MVAAVLTLIAQLAPLAAQYVAAEVAGDAEKKAAIQVEAAAAARDFADAYGGLAARLASNDAKADSIVDSITKVDGKGAAR